MCRQIFLVVFLIGLSSSSFADNRYWVATLPGNWSDPANWSDNSGGLGGFSVPGSADKVFFDDKSPGECTMDIAVDVQGIDLSQDYIGTIVQLDHRIIIGNNSFKLLSGVFKGGTAPIYSRSNMELDGADFTSTSDTLFLSSDLIMKSGIFNSNLGTVEFNAPGGADYQGSLHPITKFFNVSINLGDGKELHLNHDDSLWVTNRLDLHDGLLIHSDVVVEDTAYVHAGWDQGDAELTFMGTGNSYYLLDAATWSENDVFVHKDLALDSVVIKDVDGDGFITLGEKDRIIEVRIGVLTFEPGIRADFNYSEFRNTTDGTIIGTSDTLSLSGDYLNFGGRFVHNSGTILFDGSEERMYQSDNVPTDLLYNVILNRPGQKFTIVSGDTLHAGNDLYLTDGKSRVGILKVDGDVLISELYDRGTSQLVFSGAADQTFELEVDFTNFVSNVILDKPTPTDVTLLSPFEMRREDQVLRLIGGYLVSSSSEMLFLDEDVSWTGASDASFVAGPMIKQGDTEFTFPIGKSGEYAPLSISEPDEGEDQFMAEYFSEDVNPIHGRHLKDPSIDHVSYAEYWNLERLVGDEDVEVTLSWEMPRSGTIVELSDLGVTGWNGSLWADLGNDGQTGAPVGNNGLITTANPLSVYGAITLHSANPTNVLPVELLYFNANEKYGEVELDWSTLSEINSDNFQVERSRDGLNWEIIDEVQAMGFSSSQNFYLSTDKEPFTGSNYYRLKQNDFDGQFEYSSIEIVHFDASIEAGLSAYPNPTQGVFTLRGHLGNTDRIRMFDSSGREVTGSIEIREMSATQRLITMNALPSGFYLLRVDGQSLKIRCIK